MKRINYAKVWKISVTRKNKEEKIKIKKRKIKLEI